MAEAIVIQGRLDMSVAELQALSKNDIHTRLY